MLLKWLNGGVTAPERSKPKPPVEEKHGTKERADAPNCAVVASNELKTDFFSRSLGFQARHIRNPEVQSPRLALYGEQEPHPVAPA